MFTEKTLNTLKSSKFVIAFTGAGISAESGIPTFRGKNGLWKSFKPEEIATPEAFNRNPKLVWEWYEYRREIIKKVNPNAGHYAIAEIEDFFEKFLVITQNIDDLHRKAGTKNILELHGNIFRNKCSICDKVYFDLPQTEEKPPKCECGCFIRPDVVWFGEPVENIQEAFKASVRCDFMLVVGTSGIVQPAASLPFIAKRNGAYILEINMEHTPISEIANQSIFGESGKILPQLVNKLK